MPTNAALTDLYSDPAKLARLLRPRQNFRLILTAALVAQVRVKDRFIEELIAAHWEVVTDLLTRGESEVSLSEFAEIEIEGHQLLCSREQLDQWPATPEAS